MIFAKWLGAVEWSFGRIGTNERKNATRGGDAVILRSDFSDSSWYNLGSDLRSLYRCCPVVLIERLIPEYNNNNNNKNTAKIPSSPWVPRRHRHRPSHPLLHVAPPRLPFPTHAPNRLVLHRCVLPPATRRCRMHARYRHKGRQRPVGGGVCV